MQNVNAEAKRFRQDGNEKTKSEEKRKAEKTVEGEWARKENREGGIEKRKNGEGNCVGSEEKKEK